MSVGEYSSTEWPSGRSRIYLSDPMPTESDDKAPSAVHKGSNRRGWTDAVLKCAVQRGMLLGS